VWDGGGPSSEVAGHTGDDPEDENDSDRRPDDDSADASESVTPTTPLGPSGDSLCELAHPDHPDRSGTTAPLEPATAPDPYGGETSSRGPPLAVLAPALPGGGHGTSLPRRPLTGA